tara:strand:+ start:2161 stop:3690 length:1530 start_codon:yes stop_codon:yes gene_type:complete
LKSAGIEQYYIEISCSNSGQINSIVSGSFIRSEFENAASIFNTCPFLEGTLEGLALNEALLMEGMAIQADGMEYFTDVELHKTEMETRILIHNRSNVYQYVKELNQGKNDLFFLKQELDKKNAELERLRQMADKANEEKSRFLAMMSHEVRNPLNVILGYTELLSKEKVSRKLEGYIKNLTVSGRNLKVIVDDILDLSRVEAGKLELSNDPISLSSVLQQIEENYRSSHKDQKVELIFNSSKSLPKIVLGDDVRIYQVITNLLNNSIKFTPQGSVSTSIDLISSDEKEATVSFKVSDTGRGMTADQAATVFEEYKQNELNDNRIHKGAGLGLAIVKRLVSAMNGEIYVSSELGVGTTFTIQISFKTVIESSSKETPKEPILQENHIRGARILVADDNYLNRSIVEHILKREEANFLLVKDGVEALDALRAERFDIVLLDINMPNLSGEDLIKQKEAYAKENANTPFIALTGNSSKQDIRGYLEVGFVDVIPKPFSSAQLVGILNTNLGK